MKQCELKAEIAYYKKDFERYRGKKFGLLGGHILPKYIVDTANERKRLTKYMVF